MPEIVSLLSRERHSGRTNYTAQDVKSHLEGRSIRVADDLWIGVMGIVPEVRCDTDEQESFSP
jgi:hypothetical protein